MLKIYRLSQTLVLPFVLVSNMVWCHEPSKINDPTRIDAKLAYGVQFSQLAPTDQAYLLPGIFLGGEASPDSAGAHLTDLQLTTRLNLPNNTFFSGKLGAHSHQGAHQLEVENAWLGHYQTFGSHIIKLEAGLMATNVTPTANFHASADRYHFTPLLAEVFFGGHHQDSGVALSWYRAAFELGIEGWNGGSWPYVGNEGQTKIFAKYHGELLQLKTDIGLWASKGFAKDRSDTRYQSHGAEHQHTSANLLTPDGVFNGDVKQFGGYIKVGKSFKGVHDEQTSVFVEFEWIRNQHIGQLTTNNQSALIDVNNAGYAVTAGLSWSTHELSIQSAAIVVDNHFSNTTALFVQSQGLMNDNDEPTRHTLSYRWRWQSNVALRFELMHNAVTEDRDEQVSAVGFTWHHNLL